MNYEVAQIAFEKYLNNYDVNNGSINLKIIHTYEVVKKSEYITKQLMLNEEDICLAKIIALLHDIGRFEQIKVFGEFNDKNIDHADYGVKILFEDGLIRNFVKVPDYDKIIYETIYNHNKFQIKGQLDDRALLHSKIIRDADKLDNFRVKEKDRLEDMFPKIYNKNTAAYETISFNVYNDFLAHKCIKLNDRKTIIDYWLCVIAFIYDLNFNVSLKFVKENDYVNKLINRLEYKNSITKSQIEKIRECTLKYIENKIKIVK